MIGGAEGLADREDLETLEQLRAREVVWSNASDFSCRVLHLLKHLQRLLQRGRLLLEISLEELRLLLLLKVLHFFGCQLWIENLVQLDFRLEALNQHLDGHVEGACVDVHARLLLALGFLSVPLHGLQVLRLLAALLAQCFFEELGGALGHISDLLQTLKNGKANRFRVGAICAGRGSFVDLKDLGVHLSQSLVRWLVRRGVVLAAIFRRRLLWTCFLRYAHCNVYASLLQKLNLF